MKKDLPLGSTSYAPSPTDQLSTWQINDLLATWAQQVNPGTSLDSQTYSDLGFSPPTSFSQTLEDSSNPGWLLPQWFGPQFQSPSAQTQQPADGTANANFPSQSIHEGPPTLTGPSHSTPYNIFIHNTAPQAWSSMNPHPSSSVGGAWSSIPLSQSGCVASTLVLPVLVVADGFVTSVP